jgi:hypothetical protein
MIECATFPSLPMMNTLRENPRPGALWEPYERATALMTTSMNGSG